MIHKIALRNTIKNWRHSVSVLLSLSISFVSLVLFDGYMDDIEKMYTETFKHRQMLGDLVIENSKITSKEGIQEPWKFLITKDQQIKIDQYLLEHQNDVAANVQSLQFQGLLTNGVRDQIIIGRGFSLESAAVMRGDHWRWNTLFGEPMNLIKSDFIANLGQGLAKKLNCDFSKDKSFILPGGFYKPEVRPFKCLEADYQISTSTVDGQMNAIDLKITGIVDGGYKDIDDRYIQTSLKSAQNLMNTESITSYAVELNKKVSVAEFIKDLNQFFDREIKDIVAVRWQDYRMAEMYKQTRDFLSIFKFFIIIVIVVVSTLSVINTMIKTVKERTREIGTLRSIGFKSMQIVQMFLIESFYLSVIGGLLGCVLSLIMTVLLNILNLKYKAGLLSEAVAFRISFSAVFYVYAFLLLMTVSILACFISTRSILKSKIVDNLNYV